MTPSPFHGIFSAFGSDMTQEAAAQQESTQEEAVAPKEETSVQSSGGVQRTQTGQIAVDIFELDSYYIIRAPIAGIRMSEIDIEVDERVITIRGNRTAHDKVPDDQFYVQECFWGEFSRSVTLPCTIDPKKVKATFSKDCILKILVPKEERVKIVRISEG